MDRLTHLLHGIDKGMKGLEIGPSHNPICPKREGWNIHIVDHLSQPQLKEKYIKHGLDLEQIEAVDFICADGNFLSAIPTQHHASYGFILASHVIEHTPDLLQFLLHMQQLLSPDGVLSLAIPDKRYCFDFFRPLSHTGDVLEAHFQNHSIHTAKTAFEHVAYACTNANSIAWPNALKPDSSALKHFSLVHRLNQALEVFDRYAGQQCKEYSDFHNWKFTAASFRLILLELQLLKKIDLAIAYFVPTHNGEFIIQLTKKTLALPDSASTEAQAMRLALLCEIQHDLQFFSHASATSSYLAPTAYFPRAVRALKKYIPARLQPLAKKLYAYLCHCRPPR